MRGESTPYFGNSFSVVTKTRANVFLCKVPEKILMRDLSKTISFLLSHITKKAEALASSVFLEFPLSHWSNDQTND
jgi:hypothetical protein